MDFDFVKYNEVKFFLWRYRVLKKGMKKTIGIIMTIALLLGIISVNGLSAKAANYYGVYICGTGISTETTSGNGWSFDPETFTLTLDNFQYIHPEKTIKNVINITPLEKKVILEEIKKSDKSIKKINNYMEDILAQSELLEWGGISFNEVEWYKIRTAMKKLLIENNCEFIRFFGKIYGINSDYYIIQGLPRNYPMKNPPIHVESKGNEGINRYTFWVSNSPLEYWHELPDITADK